MDWGRETPKVSLLGCVVGDGRYGKERGSKYAVDTISGYDEGEEMFVCGDVLEKLSTWGRFHPV
jgi:hypothetical protein